MIREQLAAALRDELAALGVDAPTEVHLEQPARREHGDWSTNIALASAKAAARPPRLLLRHHSPAAARNAMALKLAPSSPRTIRRTWSLPTRSALIRRTGPTATRGPGQPMP